MRPRGPGPLRTCYAFARLRTLEDLSAQLYANGADRAGILALNALPAIKGLTREGPMISNRFQSRGALAIGCATLLALAGCDSSPVVGSLDATLDATHDATSAPDVQAPTDVPLVCAAGQIVCGGTCVYAATDNAHCGACGTVCAAGSTCVAGTCSSFCGAGTHLCGTACVADTLVSSCGTSCTPCAAPTGGTATCTAGVCGTACPAGQNNVGGVCRPFTGCHALVTCINACTTPACITACRGNTTAMGLTLYDATVSCALTVCTDASDAGVAYCSGPTDTSANCTTCLAESRRGGASGACADPRFPSCGTCSTAYDACLANP